MYFDNHARELCRDLSFCYLHFRSVVLVVARYNSRMAGTRKTAYYSTVTSFIRHKKKLNPQSRTFRKVRNIVLPTKPMPISKNRSPHPQEPLNHHQYQSPAYLKKRKKKKKKPQWVTLLLYPSHTRSLSRDERKSPRQTIPNPHNTRKQSAPLRPQF